MPLAPIEALEIVDCHHHFWDLSQKNHPWLCDPVPVHFRYGDYSSIKRNYFPADYRRDVAPYRVVKTVHEEAWWNRRRSGRRNPLRSTSVAANTACPMPCRYRPARPRRHRGSARRPREEPARARHPQLSRRGAERARGAARRSRAPWTIPSGAAATRCSSGTASRSICRCRGGTSTRRRARRRFPEYADRHRARGPSQRPQRRGPNRLAPRARARRGASERRDQDLGPRRAGPPWTFESNGPVIRDAMAIFGADRAMFASNYPVNRSSARFADDLRRLPRRGRRSAGRRAPQALPRHRRADLPALIAQLSNSAPIVRYKARPAPRSPRAPGSCRP